MKYDRVNQFIDNNKVRQSVDGLESGPTLGRIIFTYNSLLKELELRYDKKEELKIYVQVEDGKTKMKMK